MAKSTWIEELTSTPEDMREFLQEKVILDTTELISQLMNAQRVSKTELARRLGKTKGYITQLLDGRTNMTLRTISDVLFALGRSLCVSDQPIRATDAWCEIPSEFELVSVQLKVESSWEPSWCQFNDTNCFQASMN